jgi:hypothetical protein
MYGKWKDFIVSFCLILLFTNTLAMTNTSAYWKIRKLQICNNLQYRPRDFMPLNVDNYQPYVIASFSTVFLQCL